MNTATAPDAADAERRRIGVAAAEGFVDSFTRLRVETDAQSFGPRYWEAIGRLGAYRHIIHECGLAPADDADGDMPDDIFAREILQLPELEKLRGKRRVHELFFAPIGDSWTNESL